MVENLTPAERINRAAVLIGEAVTPGVAANAPTEGRIDSWLPILAGQDATNGRPPVQRSMRDTRVLLLVLVRQWKAFRYPTRPMQTTWASELLGTLNQVAHVPHKATYAVLISFLDVATKLLASIKTDSEVMTILQQQSQEAMRDHLHNGGELQMSDLHNFGSDLSASVSSAVTTDVVPSSSPNEPQTPDSTQTPTEVRMELDEPALEPGDTEVQVIQKNDLVGQQAQDEEAQLLELFFPRIPGSDVGLDSEFITFGDLRMVIFYRKDLNFALVHNHVSVFAGIGIVAGAHENREVDGDTIVHEIGDLNAYLGSLRDDQGSYWRYGPRITLSDGQNWWADPADLQWALPHNHFIGIDEATADTLELDFEYDGVRIQRSIPLRILAHDQWTPITVPEIIAAFVRPRAQAVGSVLSKTSDLLAERTGDPSLVGYQKSPDQVLETVKAIYDAVRSFDIRYSEPPASFETNGQKIRTADVVLKDRFGTCLDTTVLFAAVLEEAGIQPYIVLLRGHAVVGFTLKEIATDMVIADAEQLSNLFGSDFFIPIETTLCVAGKDVKFEDAVASAFETCSNRRAVQLAVNVRAAHRRIKPLPTVIDKGGERTLVVVENRTGNERGLPGASSTSTHEVGPTIHLTGSAQPFRVRRWRSDLLDLSFRNPLLKLSDSRGARFVVPGNDLGELENRLASNQTIQLTPHENVEPIELEQGIRTASQYDDAKLSRLFQEERRTYVRTQRGSTLNKMTNLRREAKSIKEETGATALFVSLGLLRWKSSGSGGAVREGRSPLFLLPVELTGSNTRPYSIRAEPNAGIQANYCLIEKLGQEYDLTLPQLENPPADESGIDLQRVFRELRELFLERRLDFSIEDSAHVAILQFASLDMWRDVGDSWKELTTNPVVDHLVNHPNELFQDSLKPAEVSGVDEVSTYLPLPADGGQLAAVKAATAGCNFVLEGPPGTGKSQTITNMIADGIAAGRTILFVAEKQAALTVVYERLRRVGLEPMVLNVHGKDQSINLVRDQIKRSLRASARGNASVFDALRNQLHHHIEHLEGYPGVIHDADAEHSIWDRYQRCLLLEQNYPAKAEWKPETIRVTPEMLALDLEEIRRFEQSADIASKRTRGQRLAQEWRFIGSDVDTSALEGDSEVNRVDVAITEAAHKLVIALAEVPEPLAELVEHLDSNQLAALDAWMVGLPSNQAVLPGDLEAPRLTSGVLKRRREDVLRFRQRWSDVHVSFSPGALTAKTDQLQMQYEEAQRAGFFQRRRLTKLALSKISAIATPEAVSTVEQDPLRFLELLRAFQQEQLETRERVAEGVPYIVELSLFGDEIMRQLIQEEGKARDWEEHAAITRRLLEIAPEAGTVVDTMVRQDPQAAKQGRFGASLKQFWKSWRELGQIAGATTSTIATWQQNRTLITRIRECADEWKRVATDSSAQTDFVHQIELQRVLSQLEERGLTAEVEAIQHGHKVDHLAAAVELAIERERLDRQLRGSGLDIFDSRKRNDQVDEYVRLSRELKQQLLTELPAQLLARRGESPEVSVGFRKEVDRKRGGSIRRLFENHGEEILGFIPVILMSPSAVARFLPVNSVRFDTVIFDEASQVRVADAVGSLGRADSAVIVGDSKQMPPTDIFNGGSIGDGEEDPDSSSATLLMKDARLQLGGQSMTASHGRRIAAGNEQGIQGVALAATDQESILSEAVGSGLEQRWLSWHYRSKHESLISFSNVKYYDGNLQVFPGPPEQREGLGVRVKYVNGRFDRGKTRTNQAEALTIVEEITERLRAEPEASVGVVTFNIQQRDLILDLLEQSPSLAVRKSLERESEPVFVKNLENVQGDERDIILFSIAFAKDPESQDLNHNFGPLNKIGGERRFNVAITRARREIVLFASIRSTDIDEAKTRSEGLRDLKQYLAYAEHGELQGSRNALQFNANDLYREEVAEGLRAVGLQVVTDVGTSKFRVDLAVRASDDHGWLAITLDTPEWAERQTTADRESLPSEILQGVMGWQDTVQLHLPAWIKDRTAVVEEVLTRAKILIPELSEGHRSGALDATGSSLGEDGASRHSTEMVEDEHVIPVWEVDSETTGENTQRPGLLAPMRSTAQASEIVDERKNFDRTSEYPFVEASDEEIGESSVLDRLTDRKNRNLVQHHLSEIIEMEGPIEEQRLARVLGSRFGMSRISKTRAAQILGCSSNKPEKVREFGNFYWPVAIDPSEYTGYRPRYDVGLTLPVNEISHRELANAMVAVLQNSGPLPEDTLLRETMGVFGWSRKGRNIQERLEAVIGWAIAEGRIASRLDGLYESIQVSS